MRMSMTTNYTSHNCHHHKTIWTTNQHHRMMCHIHYNWHLHQQHPSSKLPHHYLMNYHQSSTQSNTQRSHSNGNNKPSNNTWMFVQETSISTHTHQLIRQQQQRHKAHHAADRLPTWTTARTALVLHGKADPVHPRTAHQEHHGHLVTHNQPHRHRRRSSRNISHHHWLQAAVHRRQAAAVTHRHHKLPSCRSLQFQHGTHRQQ